MVLKDNKETLDLLVHQDLKDPVVCLAHVDALDQRE